jgi:hypothetical protein
VSQNKRAQRLLGGNLRALRDGSDVGGRTVRLAADGTATITDRDGTVTTAHTLADVQRAVTR